MVAVAGGCGAAPRACTTPISPGAAYRLRGTGPGDAGPPSPFKLVLYWLFLFALRRVSTARLSWPAARGQRRHGALLLLW